MSTTLNGGLLVAASGLGHQQWMSPGYVLQANEVDFFEVKDVTRSAYLVAEVHDDSSVDPMNPSTYMAVVRVRQVARERRLYNGGFLGERILVVYGPSEIILPLIRLLEVATRLFVLLHKIVPRCDMSPASVAARLGVQDSNRIWPACGCSDDPDDDDCGGTGDPLLCQGPRDPRVLRRKFPAYEGEPCPCPCHGGHDTVAQ